MTRPAKAIVVKERAVLMYSELWHASHCVLSAGLGEPRGSSWQFMSSAVLTAFTFEAYLNHVGPTVFECWPELERLPPWAKFELLCERLSVVFPGGAGKPPLQTIVKVLEFRNTMAHGRSTVLKQKTELRDTNEKLDAYLGERPLADWERLIKTEKFAQTARSDLKVVLEKLHAARPEPKEALFTFGIGIHRATMPES